MVVPRMDTPKQGWTPYVVFLIVKARRRRGQNRRIEFHLGREHLFWGFSTDLH